MTMDEKMRQRLEELAPSGTWDVKTVRRMRRVQVRRDDLHLETMVPLDYAAENAIRFALTWKVLGSGQQETPQA